MRFASLREDYWELRSAEESHAANPGTFWIPDEAVRGSLQVGQAVRLIFDIEVEEEPGKVVVQGERMWVIVSEVGDGYYIGILDNQPASYEPSDEIYLRFGAEVAFGPQHVIDVTDPPVDYSEWQLNQTPEVRWHGRDDAA